MIRNDQYIILVGGFKMMNTKNMVNKMLGKKTVRRQDDRFKMPSKEINIKTLQSKQIEKVLYSEVSSAIGIWEKEGYTNNQIINSVKDTLMDRALDIARKYNILERKANSIATTVFNRIFNTSLKKLN